MLFLSFSFAAVAEPIPVPEWQRACGIMAGRYEAAASGQLTANDITCFESHFSDGVYGTDSTAYKLLILNAGVKGDVTAWEAYARRAVALPYVDVHTILSFAKALAERPGTEEEVLAMTRKGLADEPNAALWGLEAEEAADVFFASSKDDPRRGDLDARARVAARAWKKTATRPSEVAAADALLTKLAAEPETKCTLPENALTVVDKAMPLSTLICLESRFAEDAAYRKALMDHAHAIHSSPAWRRYARWSLEVAPDATLLIELTTKMGEYDFNHLGPDILALTADVEPHHPTDAQRLELWRIRGIAAYKEWKEAKFNKEKTAVARSVLQSWKEAAEGKDPDWAARAAAMLAELPTE